MSCFIQITRILSVQDVIIIRRMFFLIFLYQHALMRNQILLQYAANLFPEITPPQETHLHQHQPLLVRSRRPLTFDPNHSNASDFFQRHSLEQTVVSK